MSEGMNTTPSPGNGITESTVLGLPVDTFAYILVGVGLGGAVLFVVIYCVAKRYCKSQCCAGNGHSPKHKTKFKSVREIWEQDTLKRKSDLEAAGYMNDAFDNMEELNVLSLHNIHDSPLSSSGAASSSEETQFKHANGGQKYRSKVQQSKSADNLYKKKRQNGVPVRMSMSSPAAILKDVPVLQVNGEACGSADFDQMPRNKLGSSLVRIEEEVIIEEELDVEKDKSKKKSKSRKKQLLTPELSSDGYAADEDAELALNNVKQTAAPGSVLTSEVVVHVDNDFEHCSDEIPEQSVNDILPKRNSLTSDKDGAIAEPLAESSCEIQNMCVHSQDETNVGLKENKESSTKTVAIETESLIEALDSISPTEKADNDGNSDSNSADHETVDAKSVELLSKSTNSISVSGENLGTEYHDHSEPIKVGVNSTGPPSNVTSHVKSTKHSEMENNPNNAEEQTRSMLKEKILQTHLINNNVHYSLDHPMDEVYSKSNGVTSNGSINGMTVSGKNSQNLFFQKSPFVDGTPHSEADKLQSWLHDVYLARSDSTNEH